jgi:TatD DNase family protein
MKNSYAIDTHCHLTLTPQPDRKAVIERARKAGVSKMVTVACNIEEIGQCIPLADEHDFIWTTAGVHPTELGTNIERDLERVYEYAKNEKKIVAIGEIGLDYYHDNFPRELQIAYFVGQLNIANQLKKPAIIHSRAGKFAGENSSIFPDIIKSLKEAHFSNGVMHCFSGNLEEAKTFLEIGLMISFTGIVTYERNQELRDIIKMMPADRIMIETDSPFLPPKNHKGEKNEPAFVIEVAKTIAEVRGLELDEVMRITSENAERFFGI